MKKSLLSHIAGNFITQYENVANSSISYLLNNYSAAKKSLANILNIGELPSIRFITELATGENGRPDVTGVDENNNKIIIIEGKFWASLTSNQPLNYLNEIYEGGKILFLSPERRKSLLMIEIEKRVVDENQRALISVHSWAELIESIEYENSKKPNLSLTSDLSQLKSLCDQMDVEGMPPLSASDLDPMNGRIVYQLSDLLDDCRKIMSTWPETDFNKVKAVAYKTGYGFYFRAHHFGCQLLLSTYNWFTTKSCTPYWLHIGNTDFKRDERIVNILSHMDPKNTYDDLPNHYLPTYAINIKPGTDRSGTAKQITKRVREVLDFLNTNLKQ